MASLALAISLASPVRAQPDQNFLTDLVLQVQQLQEEVRQLRGQVEQQAYEIENLKRLQHDQYLDLDDRLSSLSKPVAGSLDPAELPPKVLPEDPATVGQQTGTVGADVASTQTPPLAAGPLDEKGAYDKAFDSLKNLEYVTAAEGFMDFLEVYPASPLAGNAQYWLGECYYVTRNYELALDAFNSLLAQYPESGKVPDAWLKIGYTYYELQQWNDASKALTMVKEQFPGSSLSRLADNRLRTMRLEGHY